MTKYAVLVIDMLNDFVTGALGCDRARAVVPHLANLIKAARQKKVPVIYCSDSHLKDIDGELKLWGNHAIRGTKGAEIIPELKATDKDFIVLKRRYSGFFQTDLQLLLTELGVDTLIITGLHTHMCCRHTSADGFSFGYKIVVPKETTNAFTEEDYLSGLKYLKDVYGAEIITLSDLINKF